MKIYHTVNRLRSLLSSGHLGDLGDWLSESCHLGRFKHLFHLGHLGQLGQLLGQLCHLCNLLKGLQSVSKDDDSTLNIYTHRPAQDQEDECFLCPDDVMNDEQWGFPFIWQFSHCPMSPAVTTKDSIEGSRPHKVNRHLIASRYFQPRGRDCEIFANLRLKLLRPPGTRDQSLPMSLKNQSASYDSPAAALGTTPGTVRPPSKTRAG